MVTSTALFHLSRNGRHRRRRRSSRHFGRIEVGQAEIDARRRVTQRGVGGVSHGGGEEHRGGVRRRKNHRPREISVGTNGVVFVDAAFDAERRSAAVMGGLPLRLSMTLGSAAATDAIVTITAARRRCRRGIQPVGYGQIGGGERAALVVVAIEGRRPR